MAFALLLSSLLAMATSGLASHSDATASAVASYEILHSFTGNAGYGFNGDTDGANPYGPLMQAPDGNFYGTTINGSATATAPWGTIFKMDSSGRITILHHFVLAVSGDGANPFSGLTLASDGKFYGTTYTASGVTGSCANGGVLFRIDSSGEYRKVFTFSGNEGGCPKAGLIQGKDGYLYGTTTRAGYDGKYLYAGTVYRASASGAATMLHGFTAKDGFSPTCDLLQATDGALYGTAYGGGASGFGTVFRLTTSGAFTVLHNFNAADGANPIGGLIQAPDGFLYGTTGVGGQYNLGTVFKISPAGDYTVIYNFRITDGGKPIGNLLLANDGNLYGTTSIGGRNYGTIFKLTTTGQFTLLHTFGEVTGDGHSPAAGLIQATDGRLYGMTQFGGSQNKGIVFRLDLGLKPVSTASPTPTPGSTPLPSPSPRSTPTPLPSPTPTPVPSPSPGPVCSENTCGRVHGNGQLSDSSDSPDIDLDVAADSRRRSPRGHFSYHDRATRMRFRSNSITCLMISGQHATISGTGEIDGQAVNFQVDVDEGRRPDAISFSLKLSNGYQRTGVFRNARVEINTCR